MSLLNALRVLLDLLFPANNAFGALSAEMMAERMKPQVLQFETVEVYALFPYSDPLMKRIIRGIKYSKDKAVAQKLGAALAQALLEDVSDRDIFAASKRLVIPVPLGEKRHRSRGYNQMQWIVESALQAGLAGEYAPFALSRIRESSTQTALTKEERRLNTVGAFKATSTVYGRDCLLVDDVVTTGSTLTDALRALQEKGAQRVECIAICYA